MQAKTEKNTQSHTRSTTHFVRFRVVKREAKKKEILFPRNPNASHYLWIRLPTLIWICNRNVIEMEISVESAQLKKTFRLKLKCRYSKMAMHNLHADSVLFFSFRFRMTSTQVEQLNQYIFSSCRGFSRFYSSPNISSMRRRKYFPRIWKMWNFLLAYDVRLHVVYREIVTLDVGIFTMWWMKKHPKEGNSLNVHLAAMKLLNACLMYFRFVKIFRYQSHTRHDSFIFLSLLVLCHRRRL